MAYGYKAKTTDAQVAIRDAASTSGTVLMRVTKGSDIEVGTSTVTDGSGNIWRETAYGYQKVGYMMSNYISITDRTSNKYYMIQTLKDFGNDLYVRGNADLSANSGPIHKIQVALNALYHKYYSQDPSLKQVDVDGIFGPNTETAVKNAQAFMGCDVDGKVGPIPRRDCTTAPIIRAVGLSLKLPNNSVSIKKGVTL